MAGRVAGKIKLQSVDELLGVPEIAGTQEIELGRIHAFPNHPFKVLDDDKIVRRHIVGGANRTLFSVDLPPRLCRTGT